MMNVQRSTLDEGAKALKVEPQANGGGKILVHFIMEWDMIYTLFNDSGYLYDILYKVAFV